MHCRHTHARLAQVYEDEEDLHLIMELCQGGDWFEHLLTDGRCGVESTRYFNLAAERQI